MDKMHRRIILDNIGELIQLTNYKILMRRCLERKIMFPAMESEIEKLQIGNETKHKLLFEKITRRGPNAFQGLIEICKIEFTAAAALLLNKSSPFKKEDPLEDKEISIRREGKEAKGAKDVGSLTTSYSETSTPSGADNDITGKFMSCPDADKSLRSELYTMQIPPCHLDEREITFSQEKLIGKVAVKDKQYEGSLPKLNSEPSNADINDKSVNQDDIENPLQLKLSTNEKPPIESDDKEINRPQEQMIGKGAKRKIIKDIAMDKPKLYSEPSVADVDIAYKSVTRADIENAAEESYTTREISLREERGKKNEVKETRINDKEDERSLSKSNSEPLPTSIDIIAKSTAEVPSTDFDDRKLSRPQEQMIGKGAKRKIIKDKPIHKPEEGGLPQIIFESSVADIDITGKSTTRINNENASALPLKSHTEDIYLTKYSYKEISLREERMKRNEAKTVNRKSNQNGPLVPCYGCGALLHCGHSSFPGYLPIGLFEGKSTQLLKTVPCQRCNFLKNYNTAVDIKVSPEPYIEIISTMQKNRCTLAIVVVDLLDFPCSLSSDLASIVGTERPVFLVGNKVDLLPRESHEYLNHIEKCLENYVVNSGMSKVNIKHVCLISAETGYGVEELITKLHNVWEYKGDVYLLGCTNVGKSSLFNALLRSDYCKVRATNIIRKATVSPWPNTTIRSLKFPILRPSPQLLYERIPRLLSEKLDKAAEAKSRAEQSKMDNVEDAKLIGDIGQSFVNVNEDDTSRWCYDTPSTFNDESILSLLTMREIQVVVPKTMIKPRTFLFTPGMSVFLAGVGRIDYLNGLDFMRCTVYSSTELPLSIVKTEEADFEYIELLNTEQLVVPMKSDEDRLRIWPGLQFSDIFTIKGEGIDVSTCDVLLSSAGWLGLNIPENHKVEIKVWTPLAKGIFIRKPSLIP